MKQFPQQILPAGLPATAVWGYGAISSASKKGLVLHNAPSLTIETMWKRPVRIKWINDLKDAAGAYLPHLLPVDPTLHWANPPGGDAGRDTRPTFTSTPGPYTGPVPIVTHLHGAAGVGDESDGYHDHTLGMTRLNVYAGQRASSSCAAGLTARRPSSTAATARLRSFRSGPEAGRHPAEQDVPRDPDRDPGPVVQHGRVAVLSRHARALRRDRRPVHPGPGPA